MKRKGNKKILITGIIAVILICAAAVVYYKFKGNCVAQETIVTVPTGAGYEQLTDSLQAAGALRNMNFFHTTARIAGLTDKVKPGKYRLVQGMGYLDVVRMFQRGLQTPVRITFNNIRTLEQLAGRVSRQLETDSVTMAVYLLADTLPAHYGFTRETFLGMFIPDTYELYWTSPPRSFTDRMFNEYERFWNSERMAKLEETGLTRMQVITLASIVYEETKKPDEMPAVAGVYVNRVKRGMKLDADPTLKFAAGDFTLKRVLDRHKLIDSPYNTYMYAGIPPGPICMSSVTAIDAVLNYTRHDYLYLCARADFSGYHHFSHTLAEHERYARVYRDELNRLGIR